MVQRRDRPAEPSPYRLVDPDRVASVRHLRRRPGGLRSSKALALVLATRTLQFTRLLFWSSPRPEGDAGPMDSSAFIAFCNISIGTTLRISRTNAA